MKASEYTDDLSEVIVNAAPENPDTSAFFSSVSKKNSISERSGILKFHIATSHYNNGDLNKAIKYIDEALKFEPDNQRFITTRAKIFIDMNKYKEALKDYLTALMISPDNSADIYYQIGKLYVLLDIPQQSLVYLLKSFNSDTEAFLKNPEFLFFLGNSYFLNKKYDNAIYYYSLCYDYYSDNPSLLYNLGLSYFLVNKFDKSEEILNRLIEIDPSYIDAYLQLMQIYALKNNIKEANRIFDKFLLIGMNETDNIKKRDMFITEAGLYFAKKQKFDIAVSAFENLFINYPDNINIMYLLSKLYFYNQNYDSSLFLCSNIIAMNPKMPEPYIFSGYIYENKFAYKKSIESFKTALTLRPEISEIWIMTANVYFKNKDIDSAIILLENGMKNYPVINDPDVFNYIANLYSIKNNVDKVFEYFEKIIINYPNHADPHIYNYVGYSYLEKNVNFDSAFIYISKAVKSKPDNPFYTDSLAWYYFLVKKYEKSLEIIKKINFTEFEDPIIFEHYGDILSALNKKNEAVEWYNKSVLIKNSDTIQQKINYLKQ
ncbi:tetratricopeptide repeat protein [Candidatus Dependentiae bacterium]|nr:tetratricopeptide repeat protein [Candidatus Dependentiae bacterium]